MTPRQYLLVALIAAAAVALVLVIAACFLGMNVLRALPRGRSFALEVAKLLFPPKSDFGSHRHPRVAHVLCVVRRWGWLLTIIAMLVFLIYAMAQGTPMETGLPGTY